MSWVSCRGTCRGCKNLRQACRRGSATGHIHARVDRDLAHQKKSLTDRELITLAGQHDRRGLLLDDPEVDVKLQTRGGGQDAKQLFSTRSGGVRRDGLRLKAPAEGEPGCARAVVV